MQDPERTNPRRGDWLSNVWSYVRSVERRLIELEEKVRSLELDFQRSNSKPVRTRDGKICVNPKPPPPLDED